MLITKTAVILAGGKGSRLKQVVNDRPKPMALVRSKPFLYYLLEYWYQQGIRKFILLIGYDYMKIVDYFRDTYKEASVQYSVEEYPLGTGGALLKLVEDFNLEDRFVLLNGDSFIKITLEKLNFGSTALLEGTRLFEQPCWATRAEFIVPKITLAKGTC